MKDNEIIKALECCVQQACHKCPYEESNCMYVIKDALDLINRQKAEIERLKKFLNMSRKVSLARRDRNLEVGELNLKLTKELKTAKAEAIKEFAERLKTISHPYGDTQMVFELQIDNLVKEMVGENNV